MANISGAAAMEKLHAMYKDSVNKYFTEFVSGIFEDYKKKMIQEIDSKKTEIILQMVRDISSAYELQTMGSMVTIRINENSLKE